MNRTVQSYDAGMQGPNNFPQMQNPGYMSAPGFQGNNAPFQRVQPNAGYMAARVNLTTNMIGAPRAVLTRLSNDEKIVINESIFKIGKVQKYVSYCISDNPTVSRLHAQIEYENGVYYLVDKRSSNGSFLRDNKVRIESEVRYPLYNGDCFRLSNEDFIFEII